MRPDTYFTIPAAPDAHTRNTLFRVFRRFSVGFVPWFCGISKDGLTRVMVPATDTHEPDAWLF
jgi:hypothetical protein